MSHLLYLQSVDWATYEKVFVVSKVSFAHLKQWVLPELTEEKLAAFTARVLGKGVNPAKLSADEATLYDQVVSATPFEVEEASKTFAKLEVDEDWSEVFASELLEPFAAATKKHRGMYGAWG